MIDDDEIRILRRRLEDLIDSLDRGAEDPGIGGIAMLVQTGAINVYPTSAVAVYAVQALVPAGNEAEGVAPTFAAYGNKFTAINTGTKVPPSGSQVIVRLVSGRYVFRFDG